MWNLSALSFVCVIEGGMILTGHHCWLPTPLILQLTNLGLFCFRRANTRKLSASSNNRIFGICTRRTPRKKVQKPRSISVSQEPSDLGILSRNGARVGSCCWSSYSEQKRHEKSEWWRCYSNKTPKLWRTFDSSTRPLSPIAERTWNIMSQRRKKQKR